MTSDEWWAQIEEYITQKNWSGLLVCADGIQELGEESAAETLRWTARRADNGVYFSKTFSGKYWSVEVVHAVDSQPTDRELQVVIRRLANLRQEMLEFYT